MFPPILVRSHARMFTEGCRKVSEILEPQVKGDFCHGLARIEQVGLCLSPW